MNIYFLYILAALSAWGIGKAQQDALSYRRPGMLALTSFFRLFLIVFSGFALLFLHFHPLHLILSVIVFWIISLIAFRDL